MKEANHDMAIRIWSGKFGIDEAKTNSGKTFRLINLPFYIISGLSYTLKGM
jgi:hypothetical protein